MKGPPRSGLHQTVLFNVRESTITVSIARPLTQVFATVALDGSGNGIAQGGPTRPREHWQLVAAAVKTNQPARNSGQPGAVVNEASCEVYVGGAISPATFVARTITGSSGDTCGLGNQDIQSGMQVFAKWQGGDPGVTATVTLFGTYTFGPP